jgi:acyl-CoA thioesterase
VRGAVLRRKRLLNTSEHMDNELDAVKHYFENDLFARHCGMELVELRPGYAKTQMTVDQRHLNNVGTVHGGVLFTLADFAFGAASKTGGRVAVAVNMHLSCLRATRAGTLVAEASEVSRSRRISTCTVRVMNEAGELVALFQGTAFIKDEPFPPEPTAGDGR